MRKFITILLLVCALGLGGTVYWLYTSNDRSGPEIRFPQESLIYEEGMDESVLLEGVSAYDESDGDVTESLVVEQIYSAQDGYYGIYTAKDHSNNVTKAKRYFPNNPEEDLKTPKQQTPQPTSEPASQPTSEPTDQPEQKEQKLNQKEQESDQKEQEPNQDDSASKDTEGKTSGEENPAQEAEEEARREQEALIDALPVQAPRIYLNTYYLRLKKGDAFDVLDYIEDIRDDKDNYYDLWRTILTDGTVDTQNPGSYEIACYVVDADGNSSNRAVLKVIVE